MTCKLIFLMDKFDTGMSAFQIEKFVIKDQLTPYRQIRQALIEIRARLETKATIEFDLEELNLKLFIAERDQEATGLDTLEGKLLGVERKRHSYEIDRKLKVLAQIDRESSVLSADAMRIINSEFESFENFEKLIADQDFITKQEQLYWSARLARSVASDLINFNAVSKGNVEAISVFDLADQLAIFGSGIRDSVKLTVQLSQVRDTQLGLIDK